VFAAQQAAGWHICTSVFNRALVGMMMYNSETKEIAKPSELLNSIKAIMNVLQSIENYSKPSYTVIVIVDIRQTGSSCSWLCHHERASEH